MYLIIGEIDGYIGENNGNKDLTFASTEKNKTIIKKYTNLWDKIRYNIQTKILGKSDEYEKYYMKIKFNWDDDLPLNKVLKFHMLTIIVKSVFEEDSKYYPQVFLDYCLYDA